MGKIVERKKKKKGRPSLLDLQKRNLKEQQQNQQNSKRNVSAPQITDNYDSATATPLRRSTRRNPIHSPEGNDEEDDDEEGEEEEEQQQQQGEKLAGKKRREKKLKLVLKLPSSQQKSPVNSESRGSDSNLEESNAGSSRKKRKINSIGDGSGTANSKNEEKLVSGENPTSNSQGGGQLDSGPSTALPDKKLLLFILDRLQKKDIYSVFSEPVDPKELPDYHEVIQQPMDFGTIRKKLASGAYANLEQFEKDVFLVCSNAMQYNAPDTIYFRQARSIQELAKKNFENLRQDSDDNEAEPKVVRRGRPPTKNYKKLLGRPSLECAASELSSDATLASGAENTIWSTHDMRKGPLASEKSNFVDSSGKFYGSRNDAYSGWFTENRSDRSDEASALKGYTMKLGKRLVVLDENRRNTYKLFHPSAAASEASVLTTFDGERKQLLAVGVYLEHGYTGSLARFAANLGPVAWKIASKRIERCLPAEIKFGPGWVGENDVPAQRPLSLPSLSLPLGQPTSSHQNSYSAAASCAPETRADKSSDQPEADKLSEKHVRPVQSISGGHLSMPIPASGTTSSPLLAANKSSESRNKKTEASEELTSGTGFNITKSTAGGGRPRPPFQIHQTPQTHPGTNGYNGAYGFNLPAQMAKIIGASRPSGFGFQSSRMPDNFVHPANSDSNSPDPRFSENSCTKNPSCPLPNSGLHPQPSRQGSSLYQKPDSRLSPQQKPESVPPDLNIRFQSPGSPSSSRVDSAQPDLALQL